MGTYVDVILGDVLCVVEEELDELDERLGVDECELVVDVETAELDLRSKVCQ
jgi:ABC-type sulfate transport system substrate-binding protein